MQLQLCIVWGREGTGSCNCDTKVSPGFTPSLEMDATLSSQCVAVPTKYIKIINNYWGGWAKYREFSVAGRSLTLDHRVCFLNIFGKRSRRCAIFKQERLQEGEKCGFIYSWAEYYCQLNKMDNIAHEQTIILFVGSYLQVTWWLLANEKEKNFIKWYW